MAGGWPVRVRVPGDKSITQRALILAALAPGRSRLSGLLAGADPRSTAGMLRALGAEIPVLPDDGGEILVMGRGLRKLIPPSAPLDAGNSGTGARLLMGVLAAQPFATTVTGDASLQSRPMGRIVKPLGAMGTRFLSARRGGRGEEAAPRRLPLRIVGGPLSPLEYELPVASAQVKSCLLLAGLTSGVQVLLTEPGRSRDHTERMFATVGVPLSCHPAGTEGGWRVELRDPPRSIRPLDFRVPGDFSSAAFLLALGLLGGAGAQLTVEGVGLNPTRTGLIELLDRMGADVMVDAEEGGAGEEPMGSVTVRPGSLQGVEIGGDDVIAAIDEIPILAALAARSEGVTRITGAGELRVKETDRIHALAENLRAVGVEAEELEDGIEIEGTDRPLSGRVRSFDDHRIAMAFAVLGAATGGGIELDDPSVVDVSYPTFWEELDGILGRAG